MKEHSYFNLQTLTKHQQLTKKIQKLGLANCMLCNSTKPAMASMLALLLCRTPGPFQLKSNGYRWRYILYAHLATSGHNRGHPMAACPQTLGSCNHLISSAALVPIERRLMFGERKTGNKLGSVKKKPLWNDLWFTSRKQTGRRSCGRRRACFAPPSTPTNSSTIPILTATMSDPAPSTGTDSKSVNVVVKGKVQGVLFRKWTVETARKLGLNGWVRNLSDGSVEAVMSGPSAAVENMIQQCHTGPSTAQVSSVEVSKWDNDVPQGFEKRKST